MRVLVTGAAGLLGGEVCRLLHESGMSVTATDLSVRDGLPVRITVADLLDREGCYRLLEGMDAVVHCGNHPRPGICNVQRLYSENLTININVLQAAAELKTGKMIFASTIQVIAGDRRGRENEPLPPSELPYLPIDGDIPPNPGNPYALSKAATEDALRYYARHAGMSCVAIRFPMLPHPRWQSFARMSPHKFHPRGPSMLDEGFAYLMLGEAATLVQAVLNTDLPGFRVYQPAAANPMLRKPIRDIIAEFYPNVPLRQPAKGLSTLVDTSRITHETGWRALHDIYEEA